MHPKVRLLLVILFCLILVLGLWWVFDFEPQQVSPISSTPVVTSTTTQSTPVESTHPAATSTSTTTSTASNEVHMTAYTTSYTWWDNTPPGSSIIAFTKADGFPTVHDVAGGTGTYTDPITIAVGHVIANGKDTPDFKPGTRFYIPNVRAYFIVEDTCGDGDTPQNKPCHNLATADAGAQVWLDMWIEGSSVTSDTADECASNLTANHLVIENPAKNYAVVAGPIINGSTCRTQFGDTPVKI